MIDTGCKIQQKLDNTKIFQYRLGKVAKRLICTPAYFLHFVQRETILVASYCFPGLKKDFTSEKKEFTSWQEILYLLFKDLTPIEMRYKNKNGRVASLEHILIHLKFQI